MTADRPAPPVEEEVVFDAGPVSVDTLRGMAKLMATQSQDFHVEMEDDEIDESSVNVPSVEPSTTADLPRAITEAIRDLTYAGKQLPLGHALALTSAVMRPVEAAVAARDAELAKLRAQLASAASMCARPSGVCMDKDGLL